MADTVVKDELGTGSEVVAEEQPAEGRRSDSTAGPCSTDNQLSIPCDTATNQQNFACTSQLLSDWQLSVASTLDDTLVDSVHPPTCQKIRSEVKV